MSIFAKYGICDFSFNGVILNTDTNTQITFSLGQDTSNSSYKTFYSQKVNTKFSVTTCSASNILFIEASTFASVFFGAPKPRYTFGVSSGTYSDFISNYLDSDSFTLGINFDPAASSGTGTGTGSGSSSGTGSGSSSGTGSGSGSSSGTGSGSGSSSGTGTGTGAQSISFLEQYKVYLILGVVLLIIIVVIIIIIIILVKRKSKT